MAEIVHIKPPSVFNEPPPREEDFRIPEVDRDGKPVVWTMEDALDGKCAFDQIGCTKYYGKEQLLVYNVVRHDKTLMIRGCETIGDVMAQRVKSAQIQWENSKRDVELNAKLNDFLHRDGSQLTGYTLKRHATNAHELRHYVVGFLSSPIVVATRGQNFSGRYVGVYILTPEQRWAWVSIPASELNDHGAKLRARLLHAGANVSVDTEARKRLLHFILNAQAFDQGGAA